jgi:hypothetical protein
MSLLEEALDEMLHEAREEILDARAEVARLELELLVARQTLTSLTRQLEEERKR